MVLYLLADREDVARDVDRLDGFREREGVRRDDDVVATGLGGVDRHEEVVREVLGIDDGGAAGGGVGEDLETGSDANVVAIAGNTETDGARPFLVGREWLDVNQLADLGITQHRHRTHRTQTPPACTVPGPRATMRRTRVFTRGCSRDRHPDGAHTVASSRPRPALIASPADSRHFPGRRGCHSRLSAQAHQCVRAVSPPDLAKRAGPARFPFVQMLAGTPENSKAPARPDPTPTCWGRK